MCITCHYVFQRGKQKKEIMQLDIRIFFSAFFLQMYNLVPYILAYRNTSISIFCPLPLQKNIKIAGSKKLHKGFSIPSAAITGNYWAEGPTTLKIGNTRIVYFDIYQDHQYGAIQSTDLKTWTNVSDKIALPGG